MHITYAPAHMYLYSRVPTYWLLEASQGSAHGGKAVALCIALLCLLMSREAFLFMEPLPSISRVSLELTDILGPARL